MPLGTGLFLSALVLSLVILYAVTKDRWNWRRIALWSTIGPLTAVLVISAVVYLVGWWEDRPKPLESFYGIALRASERDVRFLKGEPTSKSLDGVWIYDVKDSSNNQTLGTYHVRFRDGKVRYVLYVPGGYHSDKEYPFGFSDGTKLALIEGRLGKSPNISEKPDGNARLYSYPEYNAFFGLGKGMVEIYGMYDPATGPLKFATNSSL